MKKGEKEFIKGLEAIISDLTKKYGISQSKLLNSGGGSAEEFRSRINELRETLKKHGIDADQFNALFEEYINKK